MQTKKESHILNFFSVMIMTKTGHKREFSYFNSFRVINLNMKLTDQISSFLNNRDLFYLIPLKLRYMKLAQRCNYKII